MIEIKHVNYGIGVIQKRRYGGFELLIRFENGISRWIRRDEIQLNSEPVLQPKHKIFEHKIPKDQFTARKAIEALRLGIVPLDSIDNFTIGRDKEIDYLQKWFDNKKKGSLFIKGEYGSGKSHLLEYIRSWSQNNGWAIANVEIGLEENPFHKPHQIYQELLKSFRCPLEGRMSGFRDFVRYVLKNSDAEIFETHLFFKELFIRFNELEDQVLDSAIQPGQKKPKTISEHCIWEWLEAEHNWLKPSLTKAGTAANLYCYIINAISWAVKNIAAAKGLVLLFDEAEYIDVFTYKYQHILGSNFMKGIISLSENQNVLLNERISKQKKRGYNSGLIYCGYPRNNPIRYAWQYPAHLKVIFATTSAEQLNYNIELRSMKNDDLLTIAYNVARFYQNAYNYTVSDELINQLHKKLHKNKTRLFIKYIIEALDTLRFNPHKSLENIL
jgi:hypothetical protein